MKTDLIDLEARQLHRTPSAVLISTDGANKVWLPLSQCEVYPHDTNPALVIVTMPTWFARHHELI